MEGAYPYLRSIPRKVLSLLLSSGVFSTTAPLAPDVEAGVAVRDVPSEVVVEFGGALKSTAVEVDAAILSAGW